MDVLVDKGIMLFQNTDLQELENEVNRAIATLDTEWSLRYISSSMHSVAFHSDILHVVKIEVGPLD